MLCKGNFSEAWLPVHEMFRGKKMTRRQVFHILTILLAVSSLSDYYVTLIDDKHFQNG